MHHPPPLSATTTPTFPPFYILLTTSLISLFLLFLSFTISPPSHPSQPHRILFTQNQTLTLTQQPPPPSLAYLISGSANDSDRILRLLNSIYHPRNHYLLHLDQSATQTARDALAAAVQSVPVFRDVKNVNVVGKADYVLSSNGNGPSALSATLHGASLLLRVSDDWDWFVNLSADYYPLVTQDDLLHILSYMPRDLNFVNHTSYIGWRESRKLKPIIVDPALYLGGNGEMFYATQKRQLPDAYRLFTGSSTAILSRKFIEFSILGTENLPRTLLMYLSNTPSSAFVYFPTLLCNSYTFNRTTINHALAYSSLDSRERAHFLNSTDFDELIETGAAFASPFLANDLVLDQIDREVLHRISGKPVPGGWCLGDNSNKCAIWGDAADVLKPGLGATRLERRLVEFLSNHTDQCSGE